jgi:hypothetical protein
MDISIIIAHREHNFQNCHCGEAVKIPSASAPMGLWMTIQSCESDLETTDLEYEFAVITNGADPVHADTKCVLHYEDKGNKITYHRNYKDPVAPPLARQEAVEHTTGKYLFFFDNHIMVKPGYFKRAIEMMEKYNMDMLHSTTRFYTHEIDAYHYCLSLKKNFWAEAAPAAQMQTPYRIAAGGHGGFIVRRDVFNEVGGYKWDGFKGYGGEEMYFDLKMALLDKTNWLDPKLVHYHYAGNRGYLRHYSDEFYINMMAVANIIGGQDWMETVGISFEKNYIKMKNHKRIFDLMLEAESASKEHRSWLESVRKRTLDEQLALFKEQGVAH